MDDIIIVKFPRSTDILSAPLLISTTACSISTAPRTHHKARQKQARHVFNKNDATTKSSPHHPRHRHTNPSSIGKTQKRAKDDDNDRSLTFLLLSPIVVVFRRCSLVHEPACFGSVVFGEVGVRSFGANRSRLRKIKSRCQKCPLCKCRRMCNCRMMRRLLLS